MKTNILTLTLNLLLVSILVTSCGEKSKKDAENIKDDVNALSKSLEEDVKETTEDIKTAVIADWEQFKTASENTIQNTNDDIENFRQRIAKANKRKRKA